MEKYKLEVTLYKFSELTENVQNKISEDYTTNMLMGADTYKQIQLEDSTTLYFKNGEMFDDDYFNSCVKMVL